MIEASLSIRLDSGVVYEFWSPAFYQAPEGNPAAFAVRDPEAGNGGSDGDFPETEFASADEAADWLLDQPEALECEEDRADQRKAVIGMLKALVA